MKKEFLASMLIALTLLSGCFSQQNDTQLLFKEREIKPLDLHRTVLDVLPAYDSYSKKTFQVDLRGYDLTGLNLHDQYDGLIHADFDTATKWPYWLPNSFNPKTILNNAKNPGLGVSELHAKGITGKDINVAIIDDVLLIDHEEYNRSLVYYEEIACTERYASVSGCQQASILVGKDTGLAPEANLYYIAAYYPTLDTPSFSSLSVDAPAGRVHVYEPLISAIDRIVEINRELAVEDKIRVLCIGPTISSGYTGYYKVEEAIGKAQASGIFVVSSILYETSDLRMDFNGLGRAPLGDPENPSSYKPGHNWKHDLVTFGRYLHTVEGLLVPMDTRTTAAPTGKRHYAYYSNSNISLCIPFIGGLYALACQVNPSITPSEFWEKALETGVTQSIESNGLVFSYGKIVNPLPLIEKISACP